MTGEDTASTLRMKNGAEADVQLALRERQRLDRLLTQEPEHFSLLWDIARGMVDARRLLKIGAPQSTILKRLRDYGYLRKHLTINPLTRDVLLSGVIHSPDGPMLIQPFVIGSDGDKAIVERAQKEIDESIAQWMQEMKPRDKGPDDRSR